MKQPNIQLLRAVAALLVVHTHVLIEARDVCTAKALSCNLGVLLGSSGVSLFFMISGFIMVMTTWNDFKTPDAARNFMLRRLFRIVPLYWVVTTALVVLAFVLPAMLRDAQLDVAYVTASYFFWPMERIDGAIRPMVKLGWTLNLEMMFYVVFGCSLFLERRKGLALTILALVGLVALQVTGVFSPSGALPSTPLQFWGDAIILNFIFGMLVGVLFMKGFKLAKSAFAIGVGVSVLGVIATIATTGPLETGPETLVHRLITDLPIAIFMVVVALGPQVNSRLLIWRTGLLLGNASYSLYLVHPFVLRPLTKVWLAKFSALPVPLFEMASLVVAVLFGILVYAMIEKPLTNLFSNFGRKKMDLKAPQNAFTSKFVSL